MKKEQTSTGIEILQKQYKTLTCKVTKFNIKITTKRTRKQATVPETEKH